MPPPQPSDADLLAVAERVSKFGLSICEAHLLGYGPGCIDDLAGRRFHEQAFPAYHQTLPWSYLGALANAFVASARRMTARGAPPSVADEWVIVTEFLRNAGETMLAAAPDDPPEPDDLGLMRSTPAVIKFDLLAQVASLAGARRMAGAGRAVAASLDTSSEPNPLSQEDARLVGQLLAGHRVADIANELGFSERSLYRRLDEIWRRLGVSSRTEGLAIVASRGWADPGV